MNKLMKPLFGILFILAFGIKSFGQQRYPVAPPRYQQPRYQGQPQRYPGQRRFQGQMPPIPNQQHFSPVNPRYIRPYVQPSGLPNGGRRVEQVKEAFIGRQLNLTPGQTRAFWPLYRQYVEDRTAVRIMMRQNSSANAPNGTEQIRREMGYEADLVNIRQHYMNEFLKILPPEKVSQLDKSERAFNDEMVRILSERSVRAGN